MSEQALKRLDSILKRAQGTEGGGTALPVQHGPTAVIVGYGAWPMSLNKGPNFISVVNGYRRVLARLDTALATNRPGSEPPPVRIAYGNWPCALSNETASDSRGVLARHLLGRPFFEPANGSWPIHNWPSRYFVATRALRDIFRNVSRSLGWLWLDVEQTHRALPGMKSSPCGNQHPFGALAEAHAQNLLGALRACTRERSHQCR